ncbi:MAG: helix-turn-helix domain-containing protein [Proteobacteria bacterium]|nr:helix-turn-helix domain-containing protein [Pseudomonadota bacterium]
MVCLSCNKDMTCGQTKYHYTESGLNSVFISGVEVCSCLCGEKYVSLPGLSKLHRAIAEKLIHKPSILVAEEIRFLRKSMHLSGKELASVLRVSNETVSRWENNTISIGDGKDLRLRLTYLHAFDVVPDESILNVFRSLENKNLGAMKINIDINEWMPDWIGSWETVPRRDILVSHSSARTKTTVFSDKHPLSPSGEWGYTNYERQHAA